VESTESAEQKFSIRRVPEIVMKPFQPNRNAPRPLLLAHSHLGNELLALYNLANKSVLNTLPTAHSKMQINDNRHQRGGDLERGGGSTWKKVGSISSPTSKKTNVILNIGKEQWRI